MQDLIDYAMGHGWGIKLIDLGRRNGEYSNGLIKVNPRKSPYRQRLTLAHEIGHAHHDHPWADDPVVHERQEREADVIASHLLIKVDDYAYAERIVGEHPGAIAKELGVPARYVELWRATYTQPSVRRHLRAVG